jgi:hypothetical protein
VVDSIRNPTEVEELRRVPHFVLFGVRASLENRFRRSRRRARPGDPDTLEGFRRRELQENSADPAAQQLEATFALADRVLDNDAGMDELRGAIDGLLAEFGVAGAAGSERC